MLTKLCRCRTIIPYGNKYCLACEKIISEKKLISKRTRTKQYDAGRETKYISFYNSSAWKTLREVLMKRCRYLCIECTKNNIKNIAVEAHHTIPIDTPKGWEERMNPHYIVCLCTQCHNLAHKRFCSK